MDTTMQHSGQDVPRPLHGMVWWSVFLTPTAYSLLLVLANTLQIRVFPATAIWSLFFALPVVALFVCESSVRSRFRTTAAKIGFGALTFIAMLLQFGMILVVLRAILVTRIAHAQ